MSRGLKQHLEERGVEIEEPPDEELRVEQMHKILGARRQEKFEELQNFHEPMEIGFYSHDTKTDSELRADPDDLKEQRQAIEESGLNPDAFISSIDIGPSSAKVLYEEVARRFLDFVEHEISEKREGKLKFVKEIGSNPYNFDHEQALTWFEEKDDIDLDSFNQELFDIQPDFRLGKKEKVYEQTVDKFWEDIKNRDILDYEKVKRGLLLDLTETLHGLAVNKEDPEIFNSTVDQYQDFFHRFKPEEYRKRMEKDSSYTVNVVTGRDKMTHLSNEIGTCFTDFSHVEDVEPDVSENLFKEIQMMHYRDPFTVVQAIGKDRKVEGYVRSFIMEDSEGNNFLGIDTIEAIGMNGVLMEDIEVGMKDRKDVICAGALGAIAYAEDLGLDYVAGRDARVGFGPRQGYGNKSKDIEYSKKGEPVPYYGAARFVEPDEVRRQITETGRMEEWDTPHDVEPSFKVYHDPEDLEVRGFRTEPGFHEGEVKILYESPEH